MTGVIAGTCSRKSYALDECIAELATVELRVSCPESRLFVHVEGRPLP